MKLKPQFIKLNSEQRLHKLDIPIVALTGGIATGKSSVTNLFRQAQIPVIDADFLIHEIYKEQSTIDFCEKLHPDFVSNNQIQFPVLREAFFKDVQLKKQLETFLYGRMPEVFRRELARFSNPQVVVYDIPLLYERQFEIFFDQVICVYATKQIQIARMKSRNPTWSEETIQSVLSHQIDIEIKRSRSEIVIDNSHDLKSLEQNVQKVISQLFE